MRLFGLSSRCVMCIGKLGCCDDGLSRETSLPRPAHARARLGRNLGRIDSACARQHPWTWEAEAHMCV